MTFVTFILKLKCPICNFFKYIYYYNEYLNKINFVIKIF